MKVKVERCLKYFRLTMPCGSREAISNPDNGWWTRAHATEAKRMLCALYGAERDKIRFVHLN